MIQFYTYVHFAEHTRPFYVGKGLKERTVNFKPRNRFYKNTIEKYKDSIRSLIIPASSEEEAFFLETVLIFTFRSLGYRLTNMTDGGEGKSGRPITDKMREAFINSNKNKVMSAEARAKIGAKMKNRFVSSVTREKLRRAFTGIPRPPHVIKILVDYHTGRPLSEEHKTKIVAVLRASQDKANAWHATTEGIEWHKKHGKDTWVDRKLFKRNCNYCKKEYETPFPTRSKFCTQYCKHASRPPIGEFSRGKRGPYKKRVI